MRAVFKCTFGAYRQVNYWDINYKCTPVFDVDDNIVGYGQWLPDDILEREKSYCFSEGESHNQLTLTDPSEILNMRKWIRKRADRDFVEVSCDAEAEHITEATKPVKSEPVEAPKCSEGNSPEEYTEWDLKFSNILRNS